MRENIWVSITVAILISYLTSYIVYFGFTSNYSMNYFSKDTYPNVFEKSVYKYRILSKYVLLSIDRFLDANYPNARTTRQVLYLDKKGSQNFYQAFFYLNTFFLILTSVIAVLLLHLQNVFKTTASDRILFVFFLSILINITQFCIVPYDTISYFLELLTFYVFLKYFNRRYILTLLIICFLVVLATLNRESSALTVTLIITLLLSNKGNSNESIVAMLAIALSFLLSYLALFFFVSSSPGIIISTALGNFKLQENWLGFLFWLLFFYLSLQLSNQFKNIKLIVLYHVISLPYILVILFTCVPWEVRLYIPIFLGSIFIAKLNEQFCNFSPKEILNQVTSPLLRRKHHQQ